MRYTWNVFLYVKGNHQENQKLGAFSSSPKYRQGVYERNVLS